jgi:hypothetical protein
MSRTNTSENNYLLLMFNNDTWANVGDVTGIVGSTGDGSLYVSLHTADPGEAAASQQASEATFGAYARQAVARTTSGWTVSTNTATNAAAITFPECTSGTNTITHVGIGAESTGATELIWYGAVDTSRVVTTGVTLQFDAGALDITAD